MINRDITTKETLTTLYDAYDKLNEYYFDSKLPTVIILIADTERKHSYGWFTVFKIWKDDRDNHSMHEISISARCLRRGSHFVIGVLLHEMIHLYCSENNIKDVSNGVTYHNSKFKEECEKRGLMFLQKEVCKVNGWYNTALSEEGERIVDSFDLNVNSFAISRELVEIIDSAEKSKAKENGSKTIKKSNKMEYYCINCFISFTAKKDLNLICGECQESLVCVVV